METQKPHRMVAISPSYGSEVKRLAIEADTSVREMIDFIVWNFLDSNLTAEDVVKNQAKFRADRRVRRGKLC